jgi:hypothetical protein
VDAEGKVHNVRLLPAKVVDTDLGVGHGAHKPRLGVRLVLAVAVAASGAAAHDGGCLREKEKKREKRAKGLTGRREGGKKKKM